MLDTALVLLVVAVLLIVVGISQPLASRLRLPQSVVLAAVGMAIGALPAVTAQLGFSRSIDVAAELFARLPANSVTFIYVFLPLLVFEAGIATDVKPIRSRTLQRSSSSRLSHYLVELEVRFLQQSTLHREMGRYQSLFDEGLISREIYDDLRRNTLEARSARQRPRFDIGLDTHQLVKRLDLLASLDERQLESVCRLLRPRFAVPHDQIIRKGERGDAVYFIASGVVEVLLPERRVRIGSGEFFGELALLSGRPRQADVIALTYCQFLVLRRTDFELFMKANPEARDAILRVAEARRMINISDRTASSETGAA